MKRSAFTLVEMLVVITIIGILASLITAAAISARSAAKRAVITVEIQQFDMACKAFKEKFGDYPPDFADVDRSAALAQVQRFISRAFPRCTRLPVDFQGDPTAGDELPPQYNAGTALIYWLGGIVDPTTEDRIGFSADPQNPFDVDASGNPLATLGVSRIKPFYELAPAQTMGDAATQYTYWPVGTTIDTSQLAGYVYFRADNRDYSSKNFILPGRGAVRDGTAPQPWLNPSSFQIRCCGLGGRWWGTSEATQWVDVLGVDPGPPAMSPENYDDMGNCWSGTLEDNL